MRIFVTGGAGYLGSVVTADLLRSGHEVTVFDKCVYGTEGLLGFTNLPDFKLVLGDVRDKKALDQALSLSQAEAVVHLAAVVGESACSLDEQASYDINFKGTCNIVDAAADHEVQRLLFTSTCSNYGISKPNEITDEDSSLKPLSLYARSKVQAEEFVLNNNANPHACVVLRLGTVCGLSCRMRFDLLIAELARAAALKEAIDIFSPQAWRPFLHIRDAARAINHLLAISPALMSKKVFNVVSENYQKQQLVEMVLRHYPKTSVRIIEKELDLRDYRVSNARIAQEIGFEPEHTVEEAFLEIAKAIETGTFQDRNWSRYSAVPDSADKLSFDFKPVAV